MDSASRQNQILVQLREKDFVEVETLAGAFGVSTQTIRNDLRELNRRGLVKRTHGGARRRDVSSTYDYAERRTLFSREKTAIGESAAELIPHNCSVALNIGTTTERVAQALCAHEGLTVLSNNINIVSMFLSVPLARLVIAGGEVRQSDGAIVGEEAVEFIHRYKVDFAVIGASALDTDGAVLDYDAREVAVARALIANARTVILASDSSKFNRSAPIRICAISDIDYFVTDRIPPDSFVMAAQKTNTKIITSEAIS